MTGAVLALGVVGVAGVCKITGNEAEYRKIIDVSASAVTNVVGTTRAFTGGIMDGVSGDRTAASTSASTSASASREPSAPPQPVPQHASAADPPVSVYGQVPNGGLYPQVYAPGVVGNGGNLIDLEDRTSSRKA